MTNLGEKFNFLYEKYYPQLIKYFSKRVPFDYVEDLTQKTFMNLWVYLPNIEFIKSEKSLVFTLAKNVLVDYLRTKKLLDNSLNIDDLFDLQDNENFSNVVELEADIDKLSPKEKQIIQLKKDGYNSKEIGKKLNLSASTVRTYIEKIRKKLK